MTAERSLALLTNAFNPSTGSFRNFRSADGDWLDEQGSQDTQGRALLAIGTCRAGCPGRGHARSRRRLSSAAALPVRQAPDLAARGRVRDPGLRRRHQRRHDRRDGTHLRAAGAPAAQRVCQRLDLDGDWPWPEETLTYENALLPHALIVAGVRLADVRLRSIGLHVLDWLIEVQTTRRGTFTPIGNDGWWTRGGTRSQFDQQPIEAAAMILAAAAAYESTKDAGYVRAAEAAYGWFLGDNDAGCRRRRCRSPAAAAMAWPRTTSTRTRVPSRR